MRVLAILLILVVPALAAADRPPPAAFRSALRATDDLFHEGKVDEAFARLAEVRRLAGHDLALDRLVEYQEANFHAYLGDYRAAARVLERYLRRAEAAGETEEVAAMANTVTWVYFAMDDLDAALAANERVRRACRRMPKDDATGWLHHYWWDRAYLLMEKGARARGAARAAALAAAEKARARYLELAEASEDTFGIAALEAFFAGRLGDVARATAAARSVDWRQRGDVQDLYIWAVALELVDPAEARKLRARIADGRYLMVPVQLSAMARDALAYARTAPRDAAIERLREVRGYVRMDRHLQAVLDRAIAAP